MTLNTKRRPLIAAALLLTSLGVTTSCIDNSYDLNKDIDMTINAGGEHLAIPVGYTEKITLDKIIELGEDDDLQIVNGEYHLLKSDNIDPSTTTVDPVSIDATDSDINQIAITEAAASPVEIEIETTISQNGSIKAEANNVDEAVKKIGSITAQNPVPLTIKIVIEGQREYKSIQVPDLKIQLPKFLVFAQKYPEIDDNNVLSLNLDITKGDNANIEYNYNITGYRFAEKAGEQGEISVNGKKAVIEDNGIKVTGNSTVTVAANSQGELYIKPSISIGTMSIKSITGVIQPTIDATASNVSLDNLPDFLQDDATELDIANPIFTFIAKNPLNAPIVLNGEMYGSKDGVKIDNSVVYIGDEKSTDGQSIILAPNSTTTIALSRLGAGGKEGAVNIKVSDINNLIKKIPDAVDVKLQPAITYNEYYTVDLGESYTMESSYDIDIPLSFGKDLKIVYEETIDGFDLDLEDIGIKKVVLSINAVNTIPLAMEIKNENISALDVNGNVINDIDVTVEGNITESKDGKTETSSLINITLKETTEGAIGKLDGLKLKVTAISGQATDVQLLSSQWLQLKDMKLKIPNGIKVDLN
ncbi:hypothetical protein [uncultured Bacteroides sp.]|uniref:hypothetical protein n=1 Tax=uncultured Bacteroides sp. TaxID=162156 RepID=UPI0025DA3236|nr:hypothetical protein [uncultured Bacteroides sp.]